MKLVKQVSLFAKKLSEVVKHLCASLVTCGPGTYRITFFCTLKHGKAITDVLVPDKVADTYTTFNIMESAIQCL